MNQNLTDNKTGGYSHADEIEKAHFLEDGNTDDIEGTGEGNATRVTFWTDISSRKAWKLANEHGKLAPYAGYLIELPIGNLRCVRDDLGTRFQFKPAI